MALCKRAVQSAAHFSKSVATAAGSSTSLNTRLQYRRLSQQPNVKRAFLVDTLALVRGMESQGVPSKQAEAITAAITEVLNDSLENVSNSFVSTQEMQKVELLTNQEMQKSEMLQEANLSKFKSEVKSSQDHHFSMLQRETEKLRSDIEKMRSESSLMQEHHFSMLQRETEKLKSDIDKMRSELKYEIDKATAGQRLDLNLERGRIRDELANQNAETTNLTNKLDREIHALRAQLEAAKYDVIKYCVGTLASISAVGLAVIRILL